MNVELSVYKRRIICL